MTTDSSRLRSRPAALTFLAKIPGSLPLRERACRLEGARDPEVGHQRVSLAEEDVFRLDVPVHHTLAVGIPQGVRPFAGDLQGGARRR
jgi:hypothetical protein